MKVPTLITLSALCAAISIPVIAQPDASAFTAKAIFDDMRISPKGTYLAFSEHVDNKEYLVVVNAADQSPISKTGFGDDIEIDKFVWATEERLLVWPSAGFMGGPKGPTGEIFAINIDGKGFDNLFGYRAGATANSRMRSVKESINATGKVIDLMLDDPKEVVIQSISRPGMGMGMGRGRGGPPQPNSTWVMNIETGKLTNQLVSPMDNASYLTDQKHEVRYAYGMENGVNTIYKRDGEHWSKLPALTQNNKPISIEGAFGKDSLLISDINSSNIKGLSLWQPESGKLTDLFHHPIVDSSTVFKDKAGTVWAVQFNDHYPDYFYPDPKHPLVAIHRQLRAGMQEFDVKIVDNSLDMKKVVVFISGPTNPGDYVLMDVPSAKFQLRLSAMPELTNDKLSRVDPIELVNRDGDTLRGYLTLPQGKAEKNLPMVVLPHDGPHGISDIWNFNPQAQFLASHGYAVLQVNYRGSAGRGTAFEDAGKGEWGGKMQNDISDAVLWAVKDGIADENRICVWGSGYGAYAALMGTEQNPDMFKCAVGVAGIYDLNLLLNPPAPEGDFPAMPAAPALGVPKLKEILGQDTQLLSSRSPLANAAAIKAQVMLVHDFRDFSSPIVHSEKMRDALQSNGKKLTWLAELDDSKAMLLGDERRPEVYNQIVEFIDDNIGH